MTSSHKIYSPLSLFALIFVPSLCLFSLLIIQDFVNPLDGVADIFYWDYMGYYLAKNIHFSPFPQLLLENDQAFYPYVSNNVFSPWVLEKNLFYALLYSLFGLGPWVKIYYLISIIITAIGTFILLYKDYGFWRSTGLVFIVTFANFYAVKIYPIQMSYSILHWTTLSIVTDFLLFKKVVLKQFISLRFVLIKISFIVLAIGQELGYIAGYALMSFTISLLFSVIFLGYRIFKKKIRLGQAVLSILNNYQKEISQYPRQIAILLGLIMVVLCLYFPLAFSIAKQAKSFDFEGEYNNGIWWSNPLRLLIPYFPSLNLTELSIASILRERPVSSQLDERPGLFLVILGIIGLWQAGKKITIYIPLLVLFLFCILYHPHNFPTLKLFPWFSFNRVASRTTVIYPIILGIFALEVKVKQFRLQRNISRFISFILVLLACIEMYTAYSFPPFDRDYPTFKFNNKNEFINYMNHVKQQPGEAVLDWPFCVTGGNGVGSGHNLCPYFLQNSGMFALRKYHEKKVVGTYFGRLHSSQIKPFLDAGWYKLFAPGEGDSSTGRQSRCFYPDEWSFFSDFYKYNDFAGINLYVDLLPEKCVAEFYKLFGSPVVETEVPGAGRVQFIPKSTELRQQVNPSVGLNLKYKKISELDLIRNKASDRMTASEHELVVTGLSKIQKKQKNKNLPLDFGSLWRFGFKPETIIEFNLFEAQTLALNIEFINLLKKQNISIYINEKLIRQMDSIQTGSKIKLTTTFDGMVGKNQISFQYQNTNHQNSFPHEEQTGAFTKLKLLAE
jgi:hypothetical protein